MFTALKKSYAQLRQSRPGKRFQELHERRAQGGGSRQTLMIAVGIAAIAIGLLLMILPGPGIPFLVVGFGLIAQELRVVAKALDRVELKLRALRAFLIEDLGVKIWSSAPRDKRGVVAARTERGVNAECSGGK